MKTPEDEAFDDLARRQGGGFQAKRKMAADKLHWSDCAIHNAPAYPAGKCDCGVAQEPMAWMCSAFDGGPCEQSNHDDCENPIPLYTAPPQREWVGLTDEEIHGTAGYDETRETYQFALALIAKLKEKNS
jgi:hypothetical protein